MSRFLNKDKLDLQIYMPGEQPQNRNGIIKLNTNEFPYPPSPRVKNVIQNFDYEQLRFYSSPKLYDCREKIAEFYNIKLEQVSVTGGSDEALAFIFMTFFDTKNPIAFPDITYGYYQMYADLFGVPVNQIALDADFYIEPKDYQTQNGPIIIANPNAPTGLALSTDQIRSMLDANKDRLIVVDEAYADFSQNRTMLPFINDYDNLLIVRTFSKSRALAGSRLGYVMGNEDLIRDLESIRYAFNPYNIDLISEQICIASMDDRGYLEKTVSMVKETRERVIDEFRAMGCVVLPSETNFILVKHPTIDGQTLYEKLKSDHILIRHFNVERIQDFVRITIGTDEEMDTVIRTIKGYTRGEKNA